jgi:peroxiredoxin
MWNKRPVIAGRVGLVRAYALLLFLNVLAGAAHASDAAKGLTLAGRVVEKDSKRPIEGATVLVVRSLAGPPSENPPPWIGESRVKSDANGRFELVFPPEQLANHRLAIRIARVSHPEFVSRKGALATLNALRLETLRKQLELGDKPFFDTITLERGMEYSGRAVTPLGLPAADVPLEFGCWTDAQNWSQHFYDDYTTRTGANGRFRIRMPRSHGVMVTASSEHYAPRRQFWGTELGEMEANVFAPADLGQLVLTPGLTLTGRVLDRQNRPIANQPVIAVLAALWIPRLTTTDAKGEFRFAQLRPGNYTLYGEEQTFLGDQAGLTASRPSGRTIQPIKVYLREVGAPPQVVLHETDAVKVEVICRDSAGKPDQEVPIGLSGTVPAPKNLPPPVVLPPPAAAQGAGANANERLAATIDRVEPEDPNRDVGWEVRKWPDALGRVVFSAPKGLMNAYIMPSRTDETQALASKAGEGKPANLGGYEDLGILNDNRTGITVTRYRAPIVMVTINTDDGSVPFQEPSSNTFTFANGRIHGTSLIQQADGRHRTQSLFPDREYVFSAGTNGWVVNGARHVTLPEGGQTELALTIQRVPKQLKVGELAPPVLVKTIDGRVISLADYQGKWVLVHFSRDTPQELNALKAVQDRFGNDNRLAIMLLSVYADPATLAKTAREKGYNWPLAILRDRAVDPIAIAYHMYGQAMSFLVGPDGKLLATELPAAKIMDAVAQALGAK